MKVRFAIVIGLIIFGLVSPNLALSQTHLGLHVTQEELNIWKQRASSGPYKNSGDVSSNSPGDWTRINNNANSFRSNPSAERWSGQPSGSCWSWKSSPPALPGRSLGEKMRDTGFRYLVMGDTADRNAVVNELLAQAGTTGTNWTDSTRWNTSANCLSGDAYSWQLNMWLTKLLYAYDYIRRDISSGDRTTLDAWFSNAAALFQANTHNTIANRFPNRLNDDYTTVGPDATTCISPVVTHFGGHTKCSFHEGWNNRAAGHVRFVGLVGIVVGNTTLQDRAKRWFREWVRFHVFSDNTDAEFHRWTSSQPTLGWSYTAAMIGPMATLADSFARAGDPSLYNYTTSEGHSIANLTPPGGQKNLKNIITKFLQHVDGSVTRYGTNQAAYNGNTNYRIDTVDELGGHSRNNDHYAAVTNVFYRDSYIKSVYMRQAGSAPAYPASPSGGGYCVWCGEWGTYPGLLFMFGQMEGKVSPYPGTPLTTSPPPSSVTPVAYWKFDEGTGTVAKDSSGTGNNATLVNGASWTAGRSGSAVTFDGLDDFVKIGTTNFSSSQGTFSAWVKAPFFKSGPQYIFGHTSLPVYGSRIQLYTEESGGNLDMGLGDSHTNAVNIQQLQANVWHHVTLTWGSGSYAVYVNGVQRSTGSYSGLSTLNSYAHIGGVGYDSDPQSWTGAIDEVKIWNRALSTSEVQNEYGSGQVAAPAPPSNAVAQPIMQ